MSRVATWLASLRREETPTTQHWYGYEVVNARNEMEPGLRPGQEAEPIEWRTSADLVPYAEALSVMDARVSSICEGKSRELVWLLEHPPLYTAGTSARSSDIIAARFPVHRTGRGGQLTYHGPGQRIAYVMLDLRRRDPDVRRFVATLEEWLIRTLAELGISGERREDRVGVWVPLATVRQPPSPAPVTEAKIAAIGVRIRHWVTLHGIALNVDCDLSHYSGIIPCGVADPAYGVTSLAELGHATTMATVDRTLRRTFEDLFGPTTSARE